MTTIEVHMTTTEGNLYRRFYTYASFASALAVATRDAVVYGYTIISAVTLHN